MNQSSYAVLSIALALAGCASALPANVPQQLQPEAADSHPLTLSAKGVQIYECRASKSAAAGYEWTFVAPGAELFDARGRVVARHGAGPIWQASDGSRIVGTVKQRADAPTPGAIPWLLLNARSVGPDGVFSGVTSVQRVNTAGGVAPSTGCAHETAGTIARVDYTADYVFFTNQAKE